MKQWGKSAIVRWEWGGKEGVVLKRSAPFVQRIGPRSVHKGRFAKKGERGKNGGFANAAHCEALARPPERRTGGRYSSGAKPRDETAGPRRVTWQIVFAFPSNVSEKGGGEGVEEIVSGTKQGQDARLGGRVFKHQKRHGDRAELGAALDQRTRGVKTKQPTPTGKRNRKEGIHRQGCCPRRVGLRRGSYLEHREKMFNQLWVW